MATDYHITATPPAQEEFWNCVCIQISKGYHTVIDIDDFPLISSMKWHAKESRGKTVYARKMVTINRKRYAKALHQFLFDFPVDHRDQNGLNNRRKNLRPCTQSQNCMNQGKVRGKKSSRYKGVAWNVRGQKWEVHISVDGKRFSLGRYKDEVAAALAYNEAAAKHHGEFAWLNPI